MRTREQTAALAAHIFGTLHLARRGLEAWRSGALCQRVLAGAAALALTPAEALASGTMVLI